MAGVGAFHLILPPFQPSTQACHSEARLPGRVRNLLFVSCSEDQHRPAKRGCRILCAFQRVRSLTLIRPAFLFHFSI
jgi:hypothetical protein